MPSDYDIAELLTELGFLGTRAQTAARASLEAAGLTHSGKRRISAEKLDRVKEHLEASLARSCTDPACRAAVSRPRFRGDRSREIVTVDDPRGCEFCGGSDNRRAARRLVALARRNGIRRLCIVGGSPAVRTELEELLGGELELRLIDGTERRTQDRARADVEWADLVMVWGGSELDHKVSRHYTDQPASRRKLVQLARRGIAALLNAGIEHLERNGQA